MEPIGEHTSDQGVPPAAHAGVGWRTRLAWNSGLKREGATGPPGSVGWFGQMG
jgi:hypothetical protein